MSPPTKISRIMASIAKRIGTHNGTFHCDEVLACFMLKQLPMFRDAEIVRTRDQKVLMEKCDIVVDVGGEYDHSKQRYDHHQKNFPHTFNALDPKKKWATKLSSAGLVYFHYGREVIDAIMEKLTLKFPGGVDEGEARENLFDYVYEQLVEEVDGNDNGIRQFDSHTDGKPLLANYKVNTNLPQRVKRLNTNWYDEDQNGQDKRFEQAMWIVGEELEYWIMHYIKSNLAAYKYVLDAFAKRLEGGKVMVLNAESVGCPWREHIFKIEKENNAVDEVIYVIYPDTSSSEGSHRIQCVPTPDNEFGTRLPLAWKGLRDEELSQESGIAGCIFVHMNGFIGGNRTFEGTLEMARKSLEIGKLSQDLTNA